MARVLVVDLEIKSAQSIFEILASRDGHKVAFFSGPEDDTAELSHKSPDHHTIYFAKDREQLLKVLDEYPMDFLFINERLLDDEPGAWVTRLRNLIKVAENINAPIAFLSYREEQDFVRKFMRPGISDFIFIPIDGPLFIQKFDLLLTKKVSSSDRQVYSQRVDFEIDMASVQRIEEISEFGLTVMSSKPIEVNEFMVFYSGAFADSGKAEATARCYQVEPHPEIKGLFRASFMYVGMDPSRLKNVRKWLRQQYTEKKGRNG